MSLSSKIKIFCDFDGTILSDDVGNLFFETFGGKEIWNDIAIYEEGKIGAQELFIRETARIRELTEEKIDTFCSRFTLDATFIPFVAWCEKNAIDLCIVSDGLDVYIDRILKRCNISLPVYCNSLRMLEDGRAKIEFPYADSESEDCANCKRNHLLTRSSDEDISVVIGDGYSDRCPARYADIVFAKDALIPYCQKENITFTAFKDFEIIQEKLSAILKKKRFRKPHQARMRRNAAWRMG